MSEFETVNESCHPYSATNGICNTCDVSKQDTIYRVKN